MSDAEGDASRLPPADVHDVSDSSLSAMVAEGDAAALAALYDRHAAACYGLARRIAVDEQLAQDVVQEVFLAVWRGAGRYDGARGSFTSWLLALTHHKSVDAVRRAQRHNGRRGDVVDLAGLEAIADQQADVEGTALRNARGEDVRRALGELPEDQRTVLFFAYFGGYTQSEIARLTQTPLGTVKTRTLAALRRLRTTLASAAVVQEGEL